MKLTVRELWDSRTFRVQFFSALVLGAITGPLVFMVCDTTPPYDFDVSKSEIIPKRASGGDQITVRWKVKVNRSCPGVGHRVLFDPATDVVLATYDPYWAATKSDLSNGYLTRTFLLPKAPALHPGRVGYRAEVCYSCNLLQRLKPMCVVTPSLFFVVEK